MEVAPGYRNFNNNDVSRQASNMTQNRSSTTSWGTFPESTDDQTQEVTDRRTESDMLPDLTTDNDAYLRAKGYTPAANMSAIPPNRPDISIFCKQCRRFIDLAFIQEHKNLHKSLTVLKYKDGFPDTIADLMKRRRAVIRRMKKLAPKNTPLVPVEIQKVNNAYEYVKAQLEDTFETSRRVIDMQTSVDVSGVALNCSPNCVTSVGMCQSENPHWKGQMEDARVFQDYFGNDQHKAFFAIYDGHNGRFAAEIAANELHHAILSEMFKFDPSTRCTCTLNMVDKYDITDYHIRPQSALSEHSVLHEGSTNVIHQVIRTCEEKLAEIHAHKPAPDSESPKPTTSKKVSTKKDKFSQQMEEVFTNAHVYTDILLSWGKDERSKVRWSGCSTLTVVIQDTPQEESSADEEEEEMADILSQPVSAADAPSPDNHAADDKQQPPELKQLGMIHLANAGNVRALLIRGNRHYKLTREHTAMNLKERKRVVKQGGNINSSGLINGIVPATRGLGNHGDVLLRKCIIPEPYTCSVPIDQFAQFLILGSEGLWEMFSDEEVSRLVLQTLPSNQLSAPSRPHSSVMRLLDPVPGTSQIGTSVTRESSLVDTEPNSFLDQENSHTRKKPRSSTAKRRSTTLKPMEENSQQQEDGEQARDSQQVPEGTESKKNKMSTSKNLQVGDDMVTQAGSRLDDYSDHFDDSEDEEEQVTGLDELDTTAGLSELLQTPVPSREELQRVFARGVAERLVESALMAGARANITVTVLVFPGAGI